VTISLALVSAAIMTIATITGPILDTGKSTHLWWRRLESGVFKTPHWTIAVFGILMLIAILLAARTTPRPRISRRDLEFTVLGLGGWLAFMRAGPILLQRDHFTGHVWGLVALVMLGVALTAILFQLAKGLDLALLASVPLVPFVIRSLDHTPLSLILCAVSMAVLVVLTRPWSAGLRLAGRWRRSDQAAGSGGGAHAQPAGEVHGLVYRAEAE